jgi:hypothetical protein
MALLALLLVLVVEAAAPALRLRLGLVALVELLLAEAAEVAP